MSAYFIAGTGTGVGKTFVTALLCRQLRQAGISFHAIKPVLSGYTAENNDAAEILHALGWEATLENIASISPWRFAAPISIDMAAEREGREFRLDEVITFCRRQITMYPHLLIESAGGVMSPLNRFHTVRDWISEINLPVILVAGSYLGTISHTLTAYEVLKAAGLKTVMLVISESLQNPVPLPETRSTLSRFLGSDIPVCCLSRRQEELTELVTLLKCA